MKRLASLAFFSIAMVCITLFSTPVFANDLFASSQGFLGEHFLTLIAAAIALLLFIVILVLIRRSKFDKDKAVKIAVETTKNHDSATGLPSLQKFIDECRIILQNASPDQYMIASYEMQGFSFITESYGEETTNRLLSYVASEVQGIVGTRHGLATRVESNRFIILTEAIPRTNLRREFNAMSNIFIDEFAGQNISSDFKLIRHIGVYYVSDPQKSIYTCIECAHEARYKAHSSFGNALEIFTNDMAKARDEANEVAVIMQSALNNREFIPYIQPKVDIQTGKIAGGEVLVRWQHGDRMIFPGTFIPIFEDNGFIAKLDLYMFEETCRILGEQKVHIRCGISSLSVNLSRYSLATPGIASQLAVIAKKYRVLPEMIELEVTESYFAQNKKVIIDAVEALKTRGFKVSIDDFGNDYSSLISLYEIPANCIKLDKGFVDNLFDRRGMLLVDSFITTIYKLGFQVVAEGIETQEQYDMLKDFGCNIGQGYFFSKPITVNDFIALAENFIPPEYNPTKKDLYKMLRES